MNWFKHLFKRTLDKSTEKKTKESAIKVAKNSTYGTFSSQ
jgi:hypothetical protein